MENLFDYITSFFEMPKNKKVENEQIIFYDFETTGLNPFRHKIIEYAFMKDTDDYISSLINPEIV